MRKVSTFGQTTNNNANSNDVGKVTPIKTEWPKLQKPSKKHVIILGNGFDKFLERPTTYAEFCGSEYCPKYYPAPLIQFLKQKRSKSKDDWRWYDLENELFNYSANPEFWKEPLSSIEKKVLNDIISLGFFPNRVPQTEQHELEIRAYYSLLDNHLIVSDQSGFKQSFAYDEFVNDLVERDVKAFELIKQGLVSYLKSISNKEIKPESINILKKMFANNVDEKWINSVYTFNYTQIPSIGVDEVFFVHGSLEKNNIILGTREFEGSDITNNPYGFFQKILDDNYDAPSVSTPLLEADKVSIFGHSLGKNDWQYFDEFFNRQSNFFEAKKDVPIYIYTYDKKTELDIKRSLQEMTKSKLSNLYQNHLRIITKEEYIKMFQ